MRRALVLSGGGAKGSWQVGACEHLIAERGHWFDVISGVSVGAINGAVLAHGHDPGSLRAHFDRLRAWWHGVRGNHNVYRPRPHGALGFVLGKANSLYDSTPLREEVIGREVDPQQVASSPVQLRVGYVNLRSGRYRTAGNKHPRLQDVLLASATPPIAFPPVPLRGNRVLGVDGGLRNDTQLADALRVLATLPPDDGAAEVWAILLRPPYELMQKAMIRRWLRRAGTSLSKQQRYRHVRLRILHPLRELAGSILDFDPVKIRAWYEDGLRTARAGQAGDLRV